MGSIINTALCLIGLNSPALCAGASSWKNRKYTHLESTQTNNKLITANSDFKYFAQDLENDPDFVRNLDKILIPRVVGTPNHQKVRKHIVDTMNGLGWKVEQPGFNDDTPEGNKMFTNVIATLDLDAPRRLVIACHYDSLNKPVGFLGAIDSAVPCAQMLNLAHTMHQDLKLQKLKNPEITLQFIFFDGEEAFVRWTSTDSIYGARNLAARWEGQEYSRDGVNGNHNDRIDMFVLLDLIGTADTQFTKLEQSTGDWYDRLVSIEQNLRNNRLINGNTIFRDQSVNAGIEDDHIPFKRRNVPILHLISTPFPKVWHTINDNRENLNFDRISSISKVLRVFVAEYLHLSAKEEENQRVEF
ncbi:glutaminyl-peptide cyclotransferase isoform X3 [Eurytemora carolleeae]|uniref:glutaminyl-peptide cyclotransferase isoform X2 n=1 Tax=Eurytemora carolleeae TaxID=1294199 RepID=UPI000C75D979|nr:glutaminyl-peptide cyclotransferase isoform X2 [Eurytemora carolleeae]XP_023345357.1 glutaminyl-peptide cyclotransferase isoform X3 [Eurytemora carolleeae]XP_023345358.1 glutaminyl-peptide cyclotransferase isoform X3 [Eurytemora carolleeae]|eukprot:XP_023345356.1 glutaminyl-peptide cyclotransferase-like isoform X2 [Eurytemora affinis]